MNSIKLKSIRRMVALLVVIMTMASSVMVSYADTTTADNATTAEGTTTVENASGEEETTMADMLDTPRSDFEVVVIMLCGMAFFATIVVVLSGFTARKNKLDDYDEDKRNKHMF